jgi:anaerobic ribonucleoside-triphosphate reductase activating protein
MKIRLANTIQSDSIVDGPGIRTVIWTQGCPHNCPGCHNPETHNFNGGFEMDVNELKEQLSSLRNQDGITLSGGEPMMQPVACLEIAKHAHSRFKCMVLFRIYL